MFWVLFSWFIGQPEPKISCTKTLTLPNLRLPISSDHVTVRFLLLQSSDRFRQLGSLDPEHLSWSEVQFQFEMCVLFVSSGSGASGSSSSDDESGSSSSSSSSSSDDEAARRRKEKDSSTASTTAAAAAAAAAAASTTPTSVSGMESLWYYWQSWWEVF